jgi:hypothetical protein
MQTFIENNWLSLLSIVIGVAVAYIFYRLQKRDSASAAIERKKHATIELLDVVESYVINKQPLSQHVIENLVLASERDHIVELRPSCNPISLLQDVALRLQRSRHLDIPQKTEYSLKIEELISLVRLNRDATPQDPSNAKLERGLKDFELLVPEEQRIKARKQLSILKSVLQLENERERESLLKREQSNQMLLSTTTALVGVVTAIATGLIGSGLYDKVVSPAITVLSNSLPFLGLLALIPVLLTVAATAVRIIRRNAERNNSIKLHREG